MTAQERQNAILDMLAQRSGIIKMNEIAARFEVSLETARRDLEAMQSQGLITRVYGGAILSAPGTSLGLPSRSGADHTDWNKKKAIGKAAAALVRDGERIMLGTGTTITQVARNLAGMKDLTVLTDSLSVANALLNTSFDIYLFGGKLNTSELNLSGSMGLQAIQRVYADKTFLGATGITFEYGISDYDQANADIHIEMQKRSNQTILVAQSDKFGITSFSVEMPLRCVDIVVTDTGLPQKYIDGIRELGIELILADPRAEED